jgi:nicotinamidase-related amidase
MRHFIIVDMQNNFCNNDLAAVEIIPNIVRQILKSREQGDRIIFTRDIKGTEIIPELLIDVKNDVVLCKDRFGYINWKDYIKPGDEVTLCGALTPIVASIALTLKAIEGVEVSVLKDCCSIFSTKEDEDLYKMMKTCHCKVL